MIAAIGRAYSFGKDWLQGWRYSEQKKIDIPVAHSLSSLYIYLESPPGTSLRIRMRNGGNLQESLWTTKNQSETLWAAKAMSVFKSGRGGSIEISCQKPFHFGVTVATMPNWADKKPSGEECRSAEPRVWPSPPEEILQNIWTIRKEANGVCDFLAIGHRTDYLVSPIIKSLETDFWAGLRRSLRETEEKRPSWPMTYIEEEPEAGVATIEKEPNVHQGKADPDSN